MSDGKTLEMLELQSPSPPSPLPSPASAATPKGRAPSSLSAAGIIPVWIALSSSVIIYNNYLYNTLEFPYPVFIVTWHLFFAAVGTRVLQRTTRLLDGAKDVRMDRAMFVKSILPIGILFSGSLILSNTAYLYLSVSYIQMLKVCAGRCPARGCGARRGAWSALDILADPCARHSPPCPSCSSRGPSACRTRRRSSSPSSS